jgi:hypothetical protein
MWMIGDKVNDRACFSWVLLYASVNAFIVSVDGGV